MDENNNFENITLNNYGINMVNCYNSPPCYPMHWHKAAELAWLPPDTVPGAPHRVKVYDKTYAMEPGDIVFIWPGQVHEIPENADTGLVGLQFSMESISNFIDFLPYLTSFRQFNRFSAADYPTLTAAIGDKICEIRELHQSGSPFTGVEMVIRLYHMFILLAKQIEHEPGFLKSVHHQNRDTLEKIYSSCTYIKEHLQEDLSLNTVAAQAGFSVTYFSRTFKSVMGISFVDYVNLQRVRYAETLLSEKTMPTTEVCYKAGFSSIATFNRTFKNINGCSPREFTKYHFVE